MDLWRRISDLLRADPDLSEETTKQRLIEPTLSYLGWDLFGSDVVREQPVQSHGGKDLVDYALIVDDLPKIFLEAKKLKKPLGEKEARQVLGYSRLEGVQWSVLTNGRTWRIFNANWGKNPEDAQFLEWEFVPGPSFPEAANILSKASIVSGALDRAAGESRVHQRLQGVLQGILPQLQAEIGKEATNSILASLKSELPDLAKKDVESFVTERLQLSLRPTSAPPPPPPPPPPADFPLLRPEAIPEGEVVVFPSKPSGVDFFKRYKAWGFVKLSRLPDYLALYVSGGIGRIRYLARTVDIVAPSDPRSPVQEGHERFISYEPGKRIILLDPTQIWRLEREIPIGSNKAALRTHRFFSLKSFKTAETVDDLR